MPHGEDISWQVMRQIVREWAGSASDLAEVTRLDGGCISTAMALTLNTGQKAVLKISPHRVDHAYADEAVQLAALRAAGVPTPEVYQVQTGTLDNPFSFILMEFINGVDLTSARARCQPTEFEQIQTELAELVLKLHDQTAPAYHRVCANAARHHDHWPTCYRETCDTILQESEKNKLLPLKTRKVIGKLHHRLDTLLAHDDCPRLIHGDLWATNLLLAPDCDGNNWRIRAMLDPNCKFAHVESEIAYLELFHTVTPAFMQAYQQRRKLAPDYRRIRKPIYQLYTLLNHLGLFGTEYVKPVCAAVEKVGSFV